MDTGYEVEREYLSKISVRELIVRLVKAHLQMESEQISPDKDNGPAEHHRE